MIVTVSNNECPVHTKCSGILRFRCLCRITVDDRDERPFNFTNATKAHLKFINLLEKDYGLKSFELFVLYLALYRIRPLRFAYVMKIVSTVVRYLKHIDAFDRKSCAAMLSEYDSVKYSYFDRRVREELMSLPDRRRITYLKLNATRPLAIDRATITTMIDRSVSRLQTFRRALATESSLSNDKKFAVDVMFYSLVILSFYTGARVMATLYRLTVGQYRELLSRGEIDVFGKNNVKITIYLVRGIRQKYGDVLQLPLLVLDRSRHEREADTDVDDRYVFRDNCSIKQLHTRFDKLYRIAEGGARRPDWVRWHAARRWFLGEVFSSCGLKIAAEAVSHKSIKTTAKYVLASTHSKDVHKELNKAFFASASR